VGRGVATRNSPVSPGTAPRSPCRLGLLGGTFDPPHLGHLWLAETARDQLNLDRVLFLPVGQPPHKSRRLTTSAAQRLKMLELSLSGNAAFALDVSDMRRDPPHTTYTLLPMMREKFPTAEMWLLVGSDSIRDLPEWHQPDLVVSQCRLATLPRPGIDLNWNELEERIPALRSRVDILEGPALEVSSTQIRARARGGRTIHYLVTAEVHEYIQRHRLYQS